MAIALTPRSYQIEAAQAPFNYFASGKRGNPVIAMPTGTGKSVVIALFLWNVFSQFSNQKVLVLTHVKELIQQNFTKLLALWPGAPAGINSAGLGKRDFHDRIIFAGIQSVGKYATMFGHVDLVIVDECDLVSPNDETLYQTFFKALRAINPHLKIIGLTATPWRMGHGKITEEGGIFTDICFDITGLEAFNRLIAEGYLCQLVPKKTRTELDTDGVHIRGGEFIAKELQTAVDKDEITEAALRESLELAGDRKKWLIFASGVHHAHTISEMLHTLGGMECPVVDTDISDGYRDQLIGPNGDYRTGKIRALVNNNILTTGLDVPDIDFILVLRPTMSSRLWVQMLGRGTRPFPGKSDCLVADFAGNTRRLGCINDPVIPRKKGKGGGNAPVRLCEMCNTYNHASVRKCVKCAFEFPAAASKLKQSASTEAVIKGDLPIVEVVPINNITYQLYEKDERPDSVKVTYWCGPTSFSEYICLQHEGYAAVKARRWWRERSATEAPATSREALERIADLKTPTHLRVWVNKKYPEIMAYCYDGTAFGTQGGDSVEPPTVDVRRPRAQASGTFQNNGPQHLDDDIPF
jgi:DNA repair protein RadD